MRRLMNRILEYFEGSELLTADGFDEAVIGVDTHTDRVIYSLRRCREILMSQGMSYEEALEYLDFNVVDAYVGKQTPIWCQDDV